ncbi:MAG: hypothetical protein MJB57_18500 [Gemmatimonadetes bacterium]|nr:hypothetical protein [Gemmatimonadota bacterium]
MDRERRRSAHRKRLLIALGVSAGVHAAVFSAVTLDVPAWQAPESDRALRLVEWELDDEWTTRAIRIVEETSAYGTTSARESSRGKADAPGAVGIGAITTAIVPDDALPSLAPDAPALALTMATADAPQTIPLMAARPTNRGLVVRGGGATGERGFDFEAASDAARAAERAKGGNGVGWLGGAGHEGHGHGPFGECPPGPTDLVRPWDGNPGLDEPTGQIPFIGGIGNPIGFGGRSPGIGSEKGRGIIGRRPAGGSAINRVIPGRSGRY